MRRNAARESRTNEPIGYRRRLWENRRHGAIPSREPHASSARGQAENLHTQRAWTVASTYSTYSDTDERAMRLTWPLKSSARGKASQRGGSRSVATPDSDQFGNSGWEQIRCQMRAGPRPRPTSGIVTPPTANRCTRAVLAFSALANPKSPSSVCSIFYTKTLSTGIVLEYVLPYTTSGSK